MAKNVTQFDLLLSCPSDVKEELELIKETVETFNRFLGSANNARIEVRHWSTDSYPQSGARPQTLLNKQFVLSCDAAIAVFWTRFGTPTDEYGSGTEEEIEELIKSGKQVFLYFSDCPASLSAIDYEQYKKILTFREKYKDNALYGDYSSLEDFKKKFINHLSLHFLKIFDEGNHSKALSSKSNLCIKGVINGKLVDKPVAFQREALNSVHMNELKESILSILDIAKGINILRVEKETVENKNITVAINPELSKVLSSLQQTIGEAFPSHPAKISDDDKDIINVFAEKNNIGIPDDFYYLGNLSIVQSPMGGGTYGFNPSNMLAGSEDEKKKYKLILELRKKCSKYQQSYIYFSQIDSKVFLALSLSNDGTDYDEDIDVKLFIPKGILCLKKDIPFPGDDILDMANTDFDLLYKPEKTVSIDEYYDYPPQIHIPEHMDFEDKIEMFFCYKYFEDDGYDIICYNQKYLKQNTNNYFPSYLVFNSFPVVIKYEITSKRCQNVIKGELDCKESESKE